MSVMLPWKPRALIVEQNTHIAATDPNNFLDQRTPPIYRKVRIINVKKWQFMAQSSRPDQVQLNESDQNERDLALDIWLETIWPVLENCRMNINHPQQEAQLGT